jgi:hypothetical protein
MKTTIRYNILPYLAFSFALSACSSTKTLDREQSPLMTVRVDGTNLSDEDLYSLITAVNNMQRFYAVDRNAAFSRLEDELRLQASGRVPTSKRYLRANDVQGAGAVLLGSQSCAKMMMWLSGQPFYRCSQSLTLVDGSTSMIIHSISNTTDGDLGFAQPSWTETAALFAETLPTHFTHKKQRSLTQFENSLKP